MASMYRLTTFCPQDFEKYDSVEIAQSIQTRRTRIFLLMEEVRRLRIEQRAKVRRQSDMRRPQGGKSTQKIQRGQTWEGIKAAW